MGVINLFNLVILDDSQLLRDRLKNIIEKVEQINIIAETSNTNNLLKILETDKVDILLMDIHTPGADGLKIISKIKNNNDSLIIIVVTNNMLVQYKTAAKHMGADFFIDKSKEFEKIPQILNNISKTNHELIC